MAGIEIHQEPDYAFRRTIPLAAAQTFVTGDPVYLVAQQLTRSPIDSDEIAIAEMVGFACEPATGITAGSRATAVADGFGAVTNSNRAYWPVHAPGLQLRTRNFWGTTTPGTLAAPDAANIGHPYQIVGVLATLQYGVEETAATITTHPGAWIDDVLDANMRPINESGEAGVWVVFHVVSQAITTTQDILGH
jgi:hypothetical protein